MLLFSILSCELQSPCSPLTCVSVAFTQSAKLPGFFFPVSHPENSQVRKLDQFLTSFASHLSGITILHCLPCSGLKIIASLLCLFCVGFFLGRMVKSSHHYLILFGSRSPNIIILIKEKKWTLLQITMI